MLPSSHPVPIIAPPPGGIGEAALADAFVLFTDAASRLEHSYHDLQNEVAQLRVDLAERSAQLARSREENEQTRVTLQGILQALPCGVLVVERAAGEIVLMNPEAQRLLHLQQADTLHWSAMPGRMRMAVNLAILESGEQQVCLEFEEGKRWLAIRPTTVALNRHSKAAGRSHVILILRDITADYAADRNREESRHLVALAEISTVLAHEIRNPLGAMELLAELLNADPRLEAEQRQPVRHLQAGIRSLSATVNNVLRFHSLSPAGLRPVRISDVLRSGIEFVRPLAEQAGVRLELRDDAGQAKVTGDPNALQQLVLNLACNAFRHTPAGGTFRISATVAPQTGTSALVVMEFADSGRGIAPAHLARIFDPGFSGSGEGTGLGLTVCQRVVSQHGGTISVSSRLKQGTKFRVELPAL
jgi:signal transduction histidine kinase